MICLTLIVCQNKDENITGFFWSTKLKVDEKVLNKSVKLAK